MNENLSSTTQIDTAKCENVLRRHLHSDQDKNPYGTRGREVHPLSQVAAVECLSPIQSEDASPDSVRGLGSISTISHQLPR